jgi:hypothetical protein
VCVPLAAVTRPVTLQNPSAGPYCAVLDAEAFADAAPGLRGLRLEQDGVTIPFLTTVSEPASAATDAARVMRLREQDGALVFDLAMPARAYTEIHFRLRLRDFVATAEISANGRVESFKIFDLSREKLARQTMVELPEMRESVLHVMLRAQGKSLQAEDLEGVDVLPDRAGQSLYSVAAETKMFTNAARETIAELEVGAHVPVQRIRFTTDARNFLRRVRVDAWPVNDANDVETISGTISATHRDGIEDAQLTVPMTLGANLQGPAHVRVLIENDGDGVLPLTSVTLEMREHKICFEAKSASAMTLADGGDAASPAMQAQESWERAGVAALGAAEPDTVPVKSPPGQKRRVFRSMMVAPLILMVFVLGLVVLRIWVVPIRGKLRG